GIPGDSIHAGRHGHPHRSRSGPDLRLGRRARPEPSRHRQQFVDGQAVRVGHRDAGHDRCGADPRWLRLSSGLPRRADDAGREDHPDLRGDERDPAFCDRRRTAQGVGVTIKQLYVAGAGLMGAGIAQTAIVCGYDVTLREVDDAPLTKGMENIKTRLERLLQKGDLGGAARDAALGRLHPTTSLEAAGRADFVIEAITENFDAKRDLFKRLDGICKQEAILASNTSSIPITRMAAVTRRPDRFIGMHFFNPVPRMPLVEVTRGRDTSDATLATTLELSTSLGKTPI